MSEAGDTGKKKRTYVVAAGAVIARQAVDSANQEFVGWEHRDPGGLSAKTTWVNNTPGNGEASVSEELDGLGNNVGTHGTFIPQDRIANVSSPSDRPNFSIMDGGGGDCLLDGIITPCSMVRRMGEALHLEARYWNPGQGFTYRDIPISGDLPGRSLPMSVYIPGYAFETVRNGGSGTPDDPILAGSTGEHPGQWFTFDNSWNLRLPTQQRGRKLNEDELKKLADDIKLILDSNPNCASFINSILQNAKSDANPLFSDNIFEVFREVNKQEGIYIVDNLPAGGMAWGSIANNNARIEMMARKSSLPTLSAAGNRNYSRTQQLLSARTAIAELIHHSGRKTYDDIEMSIATANHMKIPVPDYGISRPPAGQSVNAWIFSWSGWWHPKVDNHCLIEKAQQK